MTIAYMLVLGGPDAIKADVQRWIQGAPAALFRAAPGLETLDLYFPDRPAKDKYHDDGGAPLAMLQAGFRSVADIEALLGGAAFRATVVAPSPGHPDGMVAVHDVMETRFYPVAGEAAPGPLTAPLSYVVRYYRPAEDEAAFIKFYVDNHPAIEAKFPGIRNIMCYIPVKWTDPTPIAPANYLLGNEVVFDSVAALEAALASEVRHEMRADFKNFPKFNGNTHYAMQRKRLAG